MQTLRETRRAAFLSLALLGTSAAVLAAQKTIKVNFSSTAEFTTSEGKKGTAKPSTMTAAEKEKVIKSIQANYDDAVGAGNVKVEEGSGGDYDVIISGGDDPDGKKRWGNAGKQGGPAIIWENRFREKNYTGTALANGVGESAAHEIGHKLGLGHNTDDPPTKMTEGKNVTNLIRAQGTRRFNADDKKRLTKALGLESGEKKGAMGPPSGLGIQLGTTLVQLEPDDLPDDYTYLTALASVNAVAGFEFGFMSYLDEFVFQGDYGNTPSAPTPMTFEFTGAEDIAAVFEGVLYSLSLGNVSFALFDPNPDNPVLFRRAEFTFLTPGSLSFLTLDASSEPNTGGFTYDLSIAPEPSPAPLVLTGLVLLLLLRLLPPRGRRCSSVPLTGLLR